MEYILSKTVMLIFLLLTVAAFVMVKDGLANYFVQQSAVQFAKTSVGRISSIVADSTTMSYKEVVPIAPGISGGGESMAYDVNILCRRVDQHTVLIGFGVYSLVGKLVAFAPAQLHVNMGTLELKIAYHDNGFVAMSTKDHYIIISKSSDSTGNVVVEICPSVDGIGCDVTPKDVCD